MRRQGLWNGKAVDLEQIRELSRTGVVWTIETDVQVADDVDRVAIDSDSVQGLRQVVEKVDVMSSEPGQ